MPVVHVDLERAPYDIVIGRRLTDAGELIAKHLSQPRVVIVTNQTIARIWLAPLQKTLQDQAIKVQEIVLPDGEQYKNWEVLSGILDQLFEFNCERKTTLIALGGGVVGDITGFAASIYQRGIPFIQIPTTLLAQVDSSVGGKTAVNHARGKNMIGAFYQPQLVVADLSTLDTLPAREYSAGLAEVIKYGLIDNLPFFEWLEANIEALIRRDPAALAYAVEQSCASKARIVAADEREQDSRALLNLGHTFGHAIEAGLGYGTWLHGEAVAAGMVVAARVSQVLGNLSAQDVGRIEALVARAGLPVQAPQLGFERWVDLMSLDKKVADGRIRFVLMRRLGESYLGYLGDEQLRTVLA